MNWRGSPDFHVSAFIQEEMDELNWTRDRMACAMAASVAGNPGMSRLMLDMLFEVGPTDTRLRLGGMAEEIAGAFGTSAELWRGIERSWLQANGVTAPPAPDTDTEPR